MRALNLDPGETAVVALAYAEADPEVVLDDLAARRGSVRLGIPCVGTLGLVLGAKRLGIIPMARPLVERLVQVGLYLDVDYAGRSCATWRVEAPEIRILGTVNSLADENCNVYRACKFPLMPGAHPIDWRRQPVAASMRSVCSGYSVVHILVYAAP